MVDTRSVSPEEEALLDVTQRLTRQIEQQLAQLRRLRERARSEGPVPAVLGDLEHVTRRLQRDGERLRMLCGAGPSVAGARSVADVLGDAAAAAAEPVRVVVRPAPIATVSALASVELVHVLAEALDAALADTAFGITLGGRLGPAGLTVDLVLDGPMRERGAAAVAEALARRTATGIQLHRPDRSEPDAPYAIVLCPAPALTIPVQRRVDTGEMTRLAPLRPPPDPLTDPLTDPLPPDSAPFPSLDALDLGGEPDDANPLVGRPRARSPLGRDMFGVRAGRATGGSALFGGPPGQAQRNGTSNGNGNGNGAYGPAGGRGTAAHGTAGANGRSAGSATAGAPDVAPGPAPTPAPVRAGAPGRAPEDLPSGAEALFGPLPTRGPMPTPIYEAVASAWFREDGTAEDWDAAGDAEWRAAAARVTDERDEDEVASTTASGLPRRRPGRQMVTPPLRSAAAAREQRSPAAAGGERAPDRIRERLDDYQRGLQQGRHRAGESDPPAERPARWA